MKLRRLRGEFVSSGWNKRARNRRISTIALESLSGQAGEAIAALRRHDRHEFNRFVGRCLNGLKMRLSGLPDKGLAAAEFVVQITVADCLSGRRRWRTARDLEDQVADAVSMIVHLPEEADDADERRQVWDRQKSIAERKWRRSRALKSLGLSDDTVPDFKLSDHG